MKKKSFNYMNSIMTVLTAISFYRAMLIQSWQTQNIKKVSCVYICQKQHSLEIMLRRKLQFINDSLT